ncbi:MAG: ester cyclase, partial [Actinobacteria bacterium]|nr:ester cyclase [Actinomycetota bacterium]
MTSASLCPSGQLRKHHAVSEWLAAFPDSHTVIKDMVAEGDKVAGRWTTTATHRGRFRGASPTGERIEVEAIGIFRV